MENKPNEPSRSGRTTVDETILAVAELRAFLKYWADTTGVISEKQAHLLWPGLCNSMLKWLVEEGKSISFGFADIHPCPYRANWKQIMVALFPGLGPTLLYKPQAKKEEAMISSGAYAMMFSSRLLSVTHNKSEGACLVNWGLEIETHRIWRRATHAREAHLATLRGAADYARYIAGSIKMRFYRKMLNCYVSFLEQISKPTGHVVKSSVHKHLPVLRPYFRKGRVRPVALSHIPTNWIVARDPAEVAPNENTEVASADAELRSMLGLQPETEDVWTDSGVDVDEPGQST